MKVKTCVLLIGLCLMLLKTGYYAVGQENDPSLETLIVGLNNPDYYIRHNAAEGLIKAGKPAVKPIIEFLKSEDPDMRSISAEILGKIGDVRALRHLMVLLDDEDNIVRIYVINALGDLKSESAVKPLLNHVNDEDPDVRKSLAGALGKINDSLAIKPLIKMLSDENARVKESAAHALWEITRKDFGEDAVKWQEWFYKQ